jgi:hypothetical protein
MAFLSKWRNLGSLLSVLLMALTLSCYVSTGDRYSPEGSLQVFNDGNSTMDQLFVTPSSSSTWGTEQLTPRVLVPGDSITLTRLNPGYYDVLADFTDGSSDQVFDVLIQDGVKTTLSMVNSGNGAVAVVNQSGFAINGIYLTPVSFSTWGPNQTNQPLTPGQSLTLTGIAPGTYDLRVIFSDGVVVDYLDRIVISGATTTIQVI